MIKDILVEANKTLGRFNFKTVVMFPKDNHCCLSAVTEDSLCYYSIMSKEPYNHKEFAFRDWNNITSLLGTFHDAFDENAFQIDIKVNEEDYPNIIEFVNGRMKYKHYLQSYSFISKQEDMLTNYKRKKFTLKALEENYVPDVNIKDLAQLSRISNVLNEKYFHFEQDDANDLYVCYGDSEISADNAKVLIQENYEKMDFDKTDLFYSQYLTETAKGFNGADFKIQVKPNMIVICSENDTAIKVIAIKSKK